jgi:hypothetical protein
VVSVDDGPCVWRIKDIDWTTFARPPLGMINTIA